MSLNFWLRNIVLHAGSTVAAATFGSIPDVLSNTFLGPTGGAGVYAANHPLVGLLYAALFGIAREAIKGVPFLAPQSATTVGPNAPAALDTANVKS